MTTMSKRCERKESLPCYYTHVHCVRVSRERSESSERRGQGRITYCDAKHMKSTRTTRTLRGVLGELGFYSVPAATPQHTI
jgi:hypothetical protein